MAVWQTGRMATPVNEQQRAEFLASYPGWGLDGESLTRTFTFADFGEAMGFVTRLGLAAERADHHPDIDIRWNKVTLVLTTHSVGALTTKDTDLAAEISRFAGP